MTNILVPPIEAVSTFESVVELFLLLSELYLILSKFQSFLLTVLLDPILGLSMDVASCKLDTTFVTDEEQELTRY